MLLYEGSRTYPHTVRMLGTRGVPAAHGGFETAAECIGRYLVNRGWRVIVYCQVDGTGSITEDFWGGMERVLIPVSTPGARGTAVFDWHAARHAAKHHDVCLVFGYNTAMLNLLQRRAGSPLIFNMDGIEWRREKWGRGERAFLRANERIARRTGQELIADHPEIERYLGQGRGAGKITMIPYGADAVISAPSTPVRELGLTAGEYLTLICRPVPENSIVEIVRGFSIRRRGVKLAILGDYSDGSGSYQGAVRRAAGDEVMFLGSIYDPEITQALRFHSLGYLHGHTVGGTNPSLVEAMAAGNAVIAHDNPYNRWVADDCGLYFRTPEDVDAQLTTLLSQPDLARRLSARARRRHAKMFTWERIGGQYEDLLIKHAGVRERSIVAPIASSETR